jgi:phospholipid/cholesterol/gamma-HCH transport system permease protein
MAAELGTMKVSEEIDALEVMSIDPARYLVLPRLVAMAAMTPLLTIFTDAIAILGGGIIANTKLNVSWPKYYQNVQEGLTLANIYTGLTKAFVFGVTIAVVSCAEGLRTEGGAVGVGKATRTSVILCYLLILIFGYFGTAIFTRIFA